MPKSGSINGADCIYLGVKEFNARTLNSENNFTFEELKEAIQYCKKKNVKINLTLNTLIKDDEFERALKVADIAYKARISAIIVQDIGLGKTLIEKYPDIHGGLCISYSGQCLFSSAEYELAGNRGMCVG